MGVFCSSRRRHTRSDRDWSSDVCSSDLQRVLDKIAPKEGDPQTLGGISIPGTLKFTIYFSNGAADAGRPIPIIKDEELLLLRAEAEWFTGAKLQAISDLNLVRQNSGLLP